MDHFIRNNGVLQAENVPLTEIAQRYGTPTYVYSRAALEASYLAYDNALQQVPHLICYAVKANSNLAVLNCLARLGSGFDIVSVGELERVLKAGGDPAKVVFSGVGKKADEMRRALDAGIHCFNIESEPELELLSRVATECGKEASVSLRVNPDVDANTHPYISTGLKENKFGIDIERAPAVYQRASTLPNLNIVGVDCHIGSQLTTVEPFLDAMDRVLALIDALADLGITIEHLDIGGGLGVTYQDEQPPSQAEYAEAIIERLGERNLTLVLEPGRSIAANAGILLTRVQYLKHTDHKQFAVVDAAMNDMIRPSLYQAWLDIQPVSANTGNANVQQYDIVGPVCETGDFLGKDRELDITAGDLLMVASCGAYGFTMSSNYNSRPRAAEIMVDQDNSYIVRERETIADLMRGESVLPA